LSNTLTPAGGAPNAPEAATPWGGRLRRMVLTS